MPFFSTTGFSRIFAPKGLDKIQQDIDKQEQKLLDNNDIFALDARNKDEVIVSVGGKTGVSTLNFANLNLKNYRDYIEEYYITASNPEVEEAVDIIVNEIVSVEDGDDIVTLDLDKLEISDDLKAKIRERFELILDKLDFNDTCFEMVKDWYVSGRQGLYMVIDPKRPKDGIDKIIMLDPRCLRPITAVEVDRQGGIDRASRILSKERGFIYDPTILEKSRSSTMNYSYNFATQTMFIPEVALAFTDSGEKPDSWGFVPSKLHYAIKAVNNLVTVEDATVIYAITRAPERRAFFLDTGTLGAKASIEYMDQMMSRYQTEMTYDRSTGEIVNNKSTMGIVEDFWIPRREGANATDVQQLEGGQQLGEMRHVLYFQEKVYTAMKIPKSRTQGGGMVNIGGSDLAEVDREEHRFNKYTKRLGRRWCKLLTQILTADLILTNIISLKERDLYLKRMRIFFNTDSYVVERQEAETMMARINNLAQIEPYIGKMLSLETVLKKVMRMTDEEIDEERQRIKKEVGASLYGGDKGIDPVRRDEPEDEEGGF